VAKPFVSSREFLARYCDATALPLHDLICRHDDGRLGAPPFIVEPSVKFDQRDGSVSKNRFSIVVKQPKQALDIAADLCEQGWIAPRFHDEVTVFVMKGVLKKGIFAFGLDFSSQRILKVYTEYKVKGESGVLQARIDGIAVVDDTAVKLKHYVQLDLDAGYQAAVAGLKDLKIDKQLVDVVYGVSNEGVVSEYHMVLNAPLRHDALDAVISVVTVKAHELTLYLRSLKGSANA
jgi:hypothetical protein